MHFEDNTINDFVEINIRILDNIQILTMNGTLVYQNLQIAKEQVNNLFVENKNVILDLSNITKIDSTGFGLIISIYKKIPKTRKMAVVVSDPYLRNLFSITKLDAIITIRSSLHDAQLIFL